MDSNIPLPVEAAFPLAYARAENKVEHLKVVPPHDSYLPTAVEARRYTREHPSIFSRRKTVRGTKFLLFLQMNI